VKEDLSNVQGELEKMKEEIRAMKLKPNPSTQIARPAANAIVPPPQKAVAPTRKCSSSPPPPRKLVKQFPLSLTIGLWGFKVPNGIIAHLTRDCGGNVHDHNVVEVTSGSFEKETQGANPYSGAWDNLAIHAAKNAADLESYTEFLSACRKKEEDIPHTRNNWICYDFKERRIVSTLCAVRTNDGSPGMEHMKSWLVETSVDGESWREIVRHPSNGCLNGSRFIDAFDAPAGGECRFIRLVNIGRNHFGNDRVNISVWEIFGSLFE
jgi:hypothetical protein